VGPKHPHGAESPRSTAELKTTMNASKSAAAVEEATNGNKPNAKYMPNRISKGGSAAAMVATRAGGRPKCNPVIVEASSGTYRSFNTPARMNNTARTRRAIKGAT